MQPSIIDIWLGMTFHFEGDGRVSGDRLDPGNWTGGHVNVGEFRGTRWGISAARYPHLYPAKLDRDQAAALAIKDFWRPAYAQLPPALALLVADDGFHDGPERAVDTLQRIVGAYADGDLGPKTLVAVEAAARERGVIALCSEYSVARLFRLMASTQWGRSAHDFTTRVMEGLAEAAQLDLQSVAAAV